MVYGFFQWIHNQLSHYLLFIVWLKNRGELKLQPRHNLLIIPQACSYVYKFRLTLIFNDLIAIRTLPGVEFTGLGENKYIH